MRKESKCPWSEWLVIEVLLDRSPFERRPKEMGHTETYKSRFRLPGNDGVD